MELARFEPTFIDHHIQSAYRVVDLSPLSHNRDIDEPKLCCIDVYRKRQRNLIQIESEAGAAPQRTRYTNAIGECKQKEYDRVANVPMNETAIEVSKIGRIECVQNAPEWLIATQRIDLPTAFHGLDVKTLSIVRFGWRF